MTRRFACTCYVLVKSFSSKKSKVFLSKLAPFLEKILENLNIAFYSSKQINKFNCQKERASHRTLEVSRVIVTN